VLTLATTPELDIQDTFVREATPEAFVWQGGSSESNA
jgi:hypothetical protein